VVKLFDFYPFIEKLRRSLQKLHVSDD